MNKIADTAPRPVEHAIFTIERSYAASPARVYAAWSTPGGKASWFGGTTGQWVPLERTFDFRIGGSEVLEGRWNDGKLSRFVASYHNIVPEQRIVYAYAMEMNGRPISVSLATVEFRPEGSGTRLVVTEQGAFLDGYADDGSRQRGTAWLLDRLEAALATV